MRNPFDPTFFKFLLGFGLILSFSFGVLFFVGKYGALLDSTIDSKEISSANAK